MLHTSILTCTMYISTVKASSDQGRRDQSVIRDDDVMALATDGSWQKTLCCPHLGSNGPPSKVWMERLIFAVDGTTELGD